MTARVLESGRTTLACLAWLVAAVVLIATGSFLVVFGSSWAPAALRLLDGSTAGTWFELLVPFLPLFLIAAGAVAWVRARR